MLQPQQQRDNSNSNEFLKTENKGKLWSMLQQNGAFNGIGNNFFSKVREDFEMAAVRIDEEHRNKPKMQKNKIFLDFMVQRMQEYRRQSYTQPYTADEIRKTKQEAFDNALSQKQNEFSQFNAKPKPPDVSFADDDTDTSGNVNDLLEKAIRDRENLSIPGPIPKSTNQNTTSIIEVGEIAQPGQAGEVAQPGQAGEVGQVAQPAPQDKVLVDNEILKSIMDKLNTIEELLRNK